jgi:16S rRNA (uracil1498-N3)-methyltransferase
LSLPTFVTGESFTSGQQVQLGEEEAHHIRVRRLDVGTRVALLDGQGLRGAGTLVRVAKRSATVEVEEAAQEAPRRDIHLLLPIADKERMLWLAEKACELGVASWRPVSFRRSKSVAARGEGPMFNQKVTARMKNAMEQCGNAGLPAVYPEANVERAILAAPMGVRLVLDPSGRVLGSIVGSGTNGLGGTNGPNLGETTAQPEDFAPQPISIVVGPEGGIEEDELAQFVEGGFTKVALGSTILRFETAAVAALGFLAAMETRGPSAEVRSAYA